MSAPWRRCKRKKHDLQFVHVVQSILLLGTPTGLYSCRSVCSAQRALHRPVLKHTYHLCACQALNSSGEHRASLAQCTPAEFWTTLLAVQPTVDVRWDRLDFRAQLLLNAEQVAAVVMSQQVDC
jgi:hypothetical protein